MPTSLFEQVAEDVRTTLEAMTVADHGFSPLVHRRRSIKAVATRNVDQGDDGAPGTLHEVEIEIQQPEWEGGNPENAGKSYRILHFRLICAIEMSDTSEVSIDTKYNQVYSGVIAALMADPQRSGLAMDTEVLDAIDLISDMGEEAIQINVTCLVRTASESNPYAA